MDSVSTRALRFRGRSISQPARCSVSTAPDGERRDLPGRRAGATQVPSRPVYGHDSDDAAPAMPWPETRAGDTGVRCAANPNIHAGPTMVGRRAAVRGTRPRLCSTRRRRHLLRLGAGRDTATFDIGPRPECAHGRARPIGCGLDGLRRALGRRDPLLGSALPTGAAGGGAGGRTRGLPRFAHSGLDASAGRRGAARRASLGGHEACVCTHGERAGFLLGRFAMHRRAGLSHALSQPPITTGRPRAARTRRSCRRSSGWVGATHAKASPMNRGIPRPLPPRGCRWSERR